MRFQFWIAVIVFFFAAPSWAAPDRESMTQQLATIGMTKEEIAILLDDQGQMKSLPWLKASLRQSELTSKTVTDMNKMILNPGAANQVTPQLKAFFAAFKDLVDTSVTESTILASIAEGKTKISDLNAFIKE